MTETIAALMDAALLIWAVVGPVVAAALAAWLTQRAQVQLESRRERAAARAEHRQANRDLYMDALKLAERMRDHVSAWAIFATLYHQGTREVG